MYIVAAGKYREDFTDYVVKTLDDVGDLLLNEEFLTEYQYRFEEGITGFRYGERKNRNHPVELIIQYWDGYDYEETYFYLHELKVVGEHK